MTDELVPDEPSTARTVLVEALAEVMGEGAKWYSTAHGVDPGSAALAGGGAAGSVKALDAAIARLMAGRRRRRRVFVDEAERVSHLGFDELVEQAMNDERTIALLHRAVQRAQNEADEDLVRCYARAATRGVLTEDDAQVDVEARIFSTLADLDAVDVRVLLHVTTPLDPPVDEAGKPRGWALDPSMPLQGENVEDLRDALPHLGDVLNSIVSRLQSGGLLVVRGGFGGLDLWYPTPFAHLCRGRLLAEDPPGPATAGPSRPPTP